EAGRFAEKSTTLVREVLMPEPLAADQEVITQQRADELSHLIEAELLEMVRTLQEAEPAALFGATEFTIRALALNIAAKAYQQRLDQKKRLRGLPCALSPLPASRWLPRRPRTPPRQSGGHPSLPARLLLLPFVRQRAGPLRSASWHHAPPPDPGGRTPGDLGRRRLPQLRAWRGPAFRDGRGTLVRSRRRAHHRRCGATHRGGAGARDGLRRVDLLGVAQGCPGPPRCLLHD